MRISIGFGGTVFFLKFCWGNMSECGDKKLSGGGNLPWMMPWTSTMDGRYR